MKLGLVVVPTTTQLGRQDLADRIARGDIRHIVAGPEGAERLRDLAGTSSRLLVGAGPAGWVGFDEAERESAGFSPDGETRASDPLLLYFTSGTTARPKLVPTPTSPRPQWSPALTRSGSTCPSPS
jgi:acetyl-CoA synthetase